MDNTNSPNHRSRRIGSFRWWLVRPGTLVLVQTFGVVGDVLLL